MSFIDRAHAVLDETESALHALMADALKAKAYADIAAIEAMVGALAALRRNRVSEQANAGTSPDTAKATPPQPSWIAPPTASQGDPDAPKGPAPSWMRPKTP